MRTRLFFRPGFFRPFGCILVQALDHLKKVLDLVEASSAAAGGLTDDALLRRQRCRRGRAM